MAIQPPYSPRSAETQRRLQTQTGNFLSFYIPGVKTVTVPKEDTTFSVRILSPTWHALDPYGKKWDLSKDIPSKHVPDSPFFRMVHFDSVGPDGVRVLSISEMLKRFSGAPSGEATAQAKYAELGGEDPIHADWKSRTAGMDMKTAFKDGGPKTKWVAYVIDRREAPATALPKLLVIPDSTYKEFLKSTVTPEGEVVPYDDWTEDGFDIEVTSATFPGGNGAYFAKALRFSPKISKGRPAVIATARQEEIYRYVAENPIPHLFNFLSSAKLTGLLGVAAAKGGSHEEPDPTTSWGDPAEKPRTKRGAPSMVQDAEEEPLENFVPASVKAKPAARPQVVDEDDETRTPTVSLKARTKVATPTPEEMDDEPPTPKVSKSKAPVVESDDDDEVVAVLETQKKPPATSSKKAPPPAADLDDDEEMPVASHKAAPPSAKKPSQVNMDDDDEIVVAAPRVVVPPAQGAKKKAAPPPSSSAYGDDD